MTTTRVFSGAAVLAVVLARCALAVPTAEVVPGTIEVSAFAHSIHQGADAHSQVYEAQFGITPKLGVTAELARISDREGRVHIGSVYFRRSVPSHVARKPRLAGYAGVTWLDVDDRFAGKSEETGPTIGAVADLPVRPELALYGRSGVAFLDKTVWTLDFGIRYEVRPRWLLSFGYRSYDVEGTSLGGFIAGFSYTATR